MRLFFFQIFSIHLRGGHGGLRYCGIELFFKRYFENFSIHLRGGHGGLRYCGIELFFKRYFAVLQYHEPCGMRFFTLLADGIR